MSDNNIKPIYFNITTAGIVKVLLVCVLFYFLFVVREILAVLFISLVLASAVDPWIDWLERRHLPRALSMALIYLAIIALVGLAASLIIPPILEQSAELAANFPGYYESLVSGFSSLKEFSNEYGISQQLRDSLSGLSSSLQGAGRGVFSTVSGFIGGVVNFFLILVITFYMVVEENAIKKTVWAIVPSRHQIYAMHLVNRMQRKVGLWLRGQLILSLIIFSLTYVGLTVLGVKYALVLALMAGMTEFVPYLGPLLASIPGLLIAFTQNGFIFMLFVAGLYYLIQVFENNLIVPKLMQKVVGLNPIVSIAVLLIGFKIGGVFGAIMSIPVATALSVFVSDLFDNKVGQVTDK